MKTNRAFWKALHSLTHPLSILAILLLLFNDHWLRHTYPSWLTGKLGDFTWLLFAPFIAAMLFAFLIPSTIKNHTKLVGLLSIGFIGIWFATAKTVPFVHWLTTETLYAIVGYRGSLRMDVTDLITLPALLFSWHIWRHSAKTSINLKPIGYVAFGLGILVTMATSYPPTPENDTIQIICEASDGYLSTSYDNVIFPYFISDDGGFTWGQTGSPINNIRCSSSEETTAIHPNNNNLQYRWVQGEYIEQSTDAGDTWQRINDLPELNQDVREYLNHDPYYNHVELVQHYLPSPVSGLVHSETGNLVLAMSSDGAIVITPDRISHWVGVGRHQLNNLQDINWVINTLVIHQYLLPTLWCLILVTTIVLIEATSLSQNVFRHFWVSIGWLHWALLVFTAHGVLDFRGAIGDLGLTFVWGGSALLSLVLIAIPMMMWAIYYLFRHYIRALTPIIIAIVLASLAYLLPLALWTQGTIPRYYMAAFFSVLLVACVLWACYQQFKDNLPAKHQLEKAKRKQKE